MKRIIRLLIGAVVALVLVYGLWMGFKWTIMRVYVGPGEALMVTNKFGKDLPADLIAVPAGNTEYKGVQEELRGPGRYFLDPVRYEWKTIPLVEIKAGDPSRWEFDDTGHLKQADAAPEVGIVVARQGKAPPAGEQIVDPGYKGIQREVLTPGTYKINNQLYEIKREPAVIVPPGSVGVVTMRVGDVGEVASATLTEMRNSASRPSSGPAVVHEETPAPTRLVTGTAHRGILKEVLQPGIYYLNSYLVKVDIVPVGYDAISLDSRLNNSGIKFYSNDGYQVEADFTVVWGRSPSDAPAIVANIGSAKKVEENVIQPAMKAACQNVGAKYTARELIQGVTRSKFQDELSKSLEDQVHNRNVHVLLALIRNITVKDATGKVATEGLMATIQRANIEVENDLTNQQKTQTAMTKAKLDQATKAIDVARETVASETNVKVANILADAAKKAAETQAEQDLEVATVEMQIAQLDAQRTQILGKAKADVDRMKNDAEAKGAKLLVDALGTPQAYNAYTFAKNFQPTDIRLIFAGPGTFWTDLKTFEQIGASKLLQPKEKDKP